MAVTFQVEVFRVVTLCGVVVGYQRFRGPLLPHHYMVSWPRRPRFQIFTSSCLFKI